MCQVMFAICKRRGKIHLSRMRYCKPVLERSPTLPRDWTTCRVASNFYWSPLDGCEGLTIKNPVAVQPCSTGRAGCPSPGPEEQQDDDDDDDDESRLAESDDR